MKNKDIQFFFNRPDRSVNSGRITDISNGKYSDSSAIEAATEQDLDTFLREFEATEVSASVAVPAGSLPLPEVSPIDRNSLEAMFIEDNTGIWKFRHGETDRHECKENFGFRHADKWLRAVAALANNEGGYILFGVKDKHIEGGSVAEDSYQVFGLDREEFFNADPADFSNKLKSIFDPTPRIETGTVVLGEMRVGVIFVHRHPGRPVIATKNEGAVKEGDIFYRYPGQSNRIKYSDLRSMLDERDRQARERMLPMLSELLKLGPQNAMIADLNQGKLSDEKRSILIGEELLDRINFIREGEFREEEGAPTLRLVGDVQTVDGTGAEVRKAFVTPNDLIDEFLALNSPFDPKDYIRCAVEGGNGAWLPMHYYAGKAAMSQADLSEFIMRTAAPIKRREMYRDRAVGVVSAFKTTGGKSSEFLDDLNDGKLPVVTDVSDAANVGRAMAALEGKPTIELSKLLGLMKECKAIIQNSEKASWMSTLRRGLARLDELYFSL